MRPLFSSIFGSGTVLALSAAIVLAVSAGAMHFLSKDAPSAAGLGLRWSDAAPGDDSNSAGDATRIRAVRKSQAKTGAKDTDDVTGSVLKASGATKMFDFATQFDKAGASTCSKQLNALATSTMTSVEKFNTVSNWSQLGGDKRAVSLAIGQKYKDGSAVPYSVSQIVASPNNAGDCDEFAVQIFPSPLPCDKIQTSMQTQRSQSIGNLAGIHLMQDAIGRTMLIPTSANSCVIVAMRTLYAK